MNPAKLLKSVPPVAWLVAGGVVAVYLVGRAALAKLDGAGAAAGIGETLGRGAAELVGGAVSGVASGTGSILGSVIKAPSQIADSTVQSATGGRSLSLGSWIYDVFHDEYDPNAPPAAQADERTWWESMKERIW